MNPTLEKRTIEISMDNKLTIKCNGKRKLTIEYLQTHIITPFVYIFHIKCHIQLPPSNEFFSVSIEILEIQKNTSFKMNG